jgi:hypothetical protein
LEQLEAGFAAMTADERAAMAKEDGPGGEIAVRLERLLSRWTEMENGQAGPAELSLDTDEELFAFIDTKLGKSRAADVELSGINEGW